ncbi:Pyridoxine kinase [Acaryochloris thomasi RCC1774]|uniref:Pyridoxine kinase n=1 Tax=Acaryochloris thomasi RCC1774 TaxID=1764569 RepID=A0A2W1JI94_9CYAN|nr:bifunctional hydroxymethylpyrimidine kinase/phosphomethylpyrimidine kinase [Acaryochloris thomasi]PZD73026.1 Pyridoxine kinase [Acaryochloris thomasi RCC1774]
MLPLTYRPVPVALTIAGSDSGGGAGIQADLRTFAFNQVHGTSAITCVTAQNTMAVTRVDVLSPEAVIAQIEAVAEDIGFDAVKTGMLPNAEIILAVAQTVQKNNLQTLVVDPVMVSRAGARLIDEDAISTLKTHLIPHALILTPNRYEAEILSDQSIETLQDMKAVAIAIHQLGSQSVLIKGGGCTGDLQGTDVWFDGQQLEVLKADPVPTPNTHGTGCTLSAAIAAQLALSQPPLNAVKAAKDYITQALHHALQIGQGPGPVGHWFPLIQAAPLPPVTE